MSQQHLQQERSLDAWITLALVILAAVLYIPYIGSYPLWDPWEAHYSQVAMEMIWKGTWWETWYRESNRSFWSKPIFTFWLMLSSLKSFRIAQVGDFAQAEFYLRLPIALTGAIGVGYIFFFVKRLWSRTMGVLAALVLMTSPQYFLISRQIMVDIPFVVVQSIALGFLALGIFSKEVTDDEDEVKRGVRTSLFYAGLAGAAQFLEVLYWSATLKQDLATSFSQGSLAWSAIAGFFLIWAVVRTFVHNPQTRYCYLFFFFSGLSFLAKGLLSIVLPGGIVLFYMILSGDWDLLRRIRLFYVSDRIKMGTSALLGTISSLLAIWLISFPMFKGGGLSAVLREVLNFKARMGGSVYSPFAGLTGIVKAIDKAILLPHANLSMGTQLLIFFVIFFGIVAIAFFLGGEDRMEYVKAYFFPGTLIYLIVAGSWVCVMNFKHGLPFMREWFIYHHFSRIAGTIEKPNNTFDLYIKQIGFGMFPWSAVILVALVRFLRWSWKDLASHARRRNFFIFCWFFFPYVFYTYSSTKFHHYIFPVVPPLAIIISAWLARLFEEDGVLKERIGVGAVLMIFALLAKDLATNYKPLHQLFTYYTTRATPAEVFPKNSFTFLFACFALVWLTILLVRRVRFFQFGALMIPVCLFVFFVNVRLIPAVATNFSFKHLYTTYTQTIDQKRVKKLRQNAYNRASRQLKQLEQQHRQVAGRTMRLEEKFAADESRFKVVEAELRAARRARASKMIKTLVKALTPLRKKIAPLRRAQRELRGLERRMTHTKKRLYRLGKTTFPIKGIYPPFGEYSNWDERSTSYYFRNFSTYLGRQRQTINFLRKRGPVYIMVSKRKIPTLQRLARTVNKKIYILNREHYNMWLVSTQPTKKVRGRSANIVLTKRPKMTGPHWKRVNINFGNKIRMIGVWINKPKGYRRGEKVEIRFLLERAGKMKKDWQAFIHADPVKWTRHRQNWDHQIAEGLHPTSTWKKGQYIQDIVIRRIPRNFPSHYNRLHIYTGFWLGADRLRVLSANVYHDGQDRVRPIVLKLLP